MTVETTTPAISYVYNGIGDYDFDFLIYEGDTIQVVHTSDSGITSLLVENSDFTVQFDPDIVGGTVSVITTAFSGGRLGIRRVLPIEQQTEWVNGDPMDMDVLEVSFDEIVMMMQQLAVQVTEGNATSSWRGNWVTDVQYNLKDMVVGPDNNWYYAVVEHVSDDFEADLGQGYWVLTLDVKQLEDLVAQAAQSETNARLSAENAEASEDAAAISEANASDSETNAGMSEINAANCAAEAYQSEQLARQYRDEAAAIVAAGKVVEVVNENYHTATASQVVFPINPPTPERFLLVFMNSRKLRLGEDFTTDLPSLASSVVLTSPAVSGDEIDITLFNSIDGSA